MTPERTESAIYDAHFFMAWLILNDQAMWSSSPEYALARCHLRYESRKAIIALASFGWHPAHELLWKMAEFLTDIGDPLPIWLQQYIVVERSKKTCPKRASGNLVRDTVISLAIEHIAMRHAVHPARNPATSARESACSIVQRGLERLGIHMTEANVNAIWQKTRKRAERRPDPNKDIFGDLDLWFRLNSQNR